MKFNPSVFKAYDIRGESNDGLTPELAYAVGQSLAHYLPAGTVVVGQDMRLDSKILAEKLIHGLIEQGRDVFDLGEVSTDMVYFAIQKYKLAGGAMVTASHDPKGYNGIKLTKGDGSPIGLGTGLEIIRSMVEKGKFVQSKNPGKKQQKDILEEWVEFALEVGGKIEKPLKIVWDAGNGMGGIVVEKVRAKTPLQITGLFLEPDGSFPNHQPNPMLAENLRTLKSTVEEGNFDCGVAFDGDADRAMFIDENGQIVDASELGLLLAKDILSSNPASVVYNVACSRAVKEIVLQMGGEAVRAKVGRPSIKKAMKESNASLGIEQAQHYYFKEFNNDTSGLITCLRALHILSNSDKSISELIKPFKKYTRLPEKVISVIDSSNAISLIKENIQYDKADELDGLSIYTKNWWANIRSSNTEPLLRINIEGTSETEVAQASHSLEDLLKNA